ncbi:hypothetical protein [Microvirga sp. VF16]|uniref:hypothetical protein n=1 Tax=Microvirga sp. VF16 TaxID=2807101 RepID=UPI00193EB1A3|nr:hypothetical protein [Microvirga sp. VF16]QRM33195.1 hypothetical protein JO965_28365 [Microvirga sp. VF16]
MMSDYTGHDRPFPDWYPYVFLAVMIAGAALCGQMIFGTTSSSPQPPEEISIARNKPAGITHRRS